MTLNAIKRRRVDLIYDYRMARKRHRRSAKIYNILKELTTQQLKREANERYGNSR